MRNKVIFFLAGAAVATAVYLVIPDTKSNAQLEPVAFGTSIDLNQHSPGKAYEYIIELEYKTPTRVDVQYDTISGIPAPHPGHVIIPEIKYHIGRYWWRGKTTPSFDRSIIEKIDSSAILHRRISIRMLK